MISVASARALAGTGLVWEPVRGDRFIIPDRGMDEDVFVLSDMTIEAQDHATGRMLGFNGTTEWALDSVAAADVLWLPGEGALRALLGPALVSLEPAGLAGWSVSVAGDDGPTRVVHPDAEEAYALALLRVRAARSADLLPLAAHAALVAVDELDTVEGAGSGSAPGPAGSSEAGWRAVGGDGRTRAEVLEDLVTSLRRTRALFSGADESAAGEQVRLVADVDPVAEDRAGTLRRATAAVLREVGDGEGADRALVALVAATGALGASPDRVCVGAAVAAARAGTGSEVDRAALEAMG